MPDFISLCAPEKNSSFVSNFYNQGEFELLRVTPLIFFPFGWKRRNCGGNWVFSKETSTAPTFWLLHSSSTITYVLVARVDTK